MAKDAKGHGSDKRGGSGLSPTEQRMADHGARVLGAINAMGDQHPKSAAVPTHEGASGRTESRGVGVDGFGMTPEEAGGHVSSGRMSSPPLGVYRDKETYDRYRAALSKGKSGASGPTPRFNGGHFAGGLGKFKA